MPPLVWTWIFSWFSGKYETPGKDGSNEPAKLGVEAAYTGSPRSHMLAAFQDDWLATDHQQKPSPPCPASAPAPHGAPTWCYERPTARTPFRICSTPTHLLHRWTSLVLNRASIAPLPIQATPYKFKQQENDHSSLGVIRRVCF